MEINYLNISSGLTTFVLLIENHLTVVELLDNRTGKVFIGACLVYMTETVSTQAWIGIN